MKMEPFRFGGVVERPASRGFAASILSAVALTVPLIPAFSLAAGSNSYWRAFVVTWATGALPGLVFAVVVARKPRLPRVVAGMAILEVMIIGAAYLVVLATAGLE
jgi:ABC-type uncharacterized transport system permease subunit